MVKVLIADNELCTGCGICELACSYRWFKVFNPKRSAIRAIKLEPGIDVITFCTQCGICIDACPTKAIKRDPVSKIVKVDFEKCGACEDCVVACPYGAIHVDPIIKKAIKCDTCNGNPECVKRCPQSVLKFVEISDAVFWKQRDSAKAIASTPQLSKKLWYRPPLK